MHRSSQCLSTASRNRAHRTSFRLSQVRSSHAPVPRLDYKYIRDNADVVVQNCKNRKIGISSSQVEEIVERYKTLSVIVNDLNQCLSRRNMLTAQIKSATAEQRPTLLEEAAALKPQVQTLQEKKDTLDDLLLKLTLSIPNTTHPSTPIGNESKCKIFSYVNEMNQFTADNEGMDHVEIARRLDLVDFQSAARASGTGFYYLKNEAVLLELAMTQFALKKASDAGFQMMRCPDLIRTEFIPACGFQPRDADGQQIYAVENGNLSLVGTAEIPLAALGVDKTFSEEELPRRYVAVGRAFRAEAGARGSDTRGLFRVHEFTKVELFTFCAPTSSEVELDHILRLQKSIVSDLGLCARVLEMPTEELGAPAHRKFDIEAWIPSRNDWGEITSASDCTDYQARRLNARVKTNTSTEFVHTLNGTAVAIPRLLVAGLENWMSHGRIKIPRCLHPYTGGIIEIGTKNVA